MLPNSEIVLFCGANVLKTTRKGGDVEVGMVRKGPNGLALVVAFEAGGKRSVFAATLVKAGWRALPSMSVLPARRTNSRGRDCDAVYSEAEALRAVRSVFALAYPGEPLLEAYSGPQRKKIND